MRRVCFSLPVLVLGALAFVALAVGGKNLLGAEKTARELLPESTVGYLEIPAPQKLLETVIDHPGVKEVLQSPLYEPALKQAYQSPQYHKLIEVRDAVEKQLGMPWRPTLNSLTSGGVYVGFDLPTQGVAMLAKATDAATADKARETLLALARAEAKGRNASDPVKQDTYRGLTLYQIGEVHHATFGPWVVTTNKFLLLRMIAENYLDDGKSIGGEEQFQTVYNQREADSSAWLYVDLRVLRTLGVLKSALGKKSDNPAIELLVGGILGALPDAPYVSASVKVSQSQLQLVATLPCDIQAVSKTRDFYFGTDGKGDAPALLKPKGTLLTLSSYRDFFSLWRHAPDLFDDKINAAFAESEGNLKTLFSGRDFRDDILGNLEPGMQLVVARQRFSPTGVTPTVKLPAGAVVVRMKNPAETAKIFKITYQSLIGFLNITGGMNGLDPLDLSSEKTPYGLVVSSEYLPSAKLETKQAAPIHFNASPTVAFVGDKFVLSSSKQLAEDLAELLSTEQATALQTNTALFVDGNVGREMLQENRGPIIAGSMLEKGHDEATAGKEFDAGMKAATLLQSAALSLTTKEKHLRLSLEINLAKP